MKKEILEKILSVHLENGDYCKAEWIVVCLLNRKLTAAELIKMLQKSVEEGWFSQAKEMARFLGRRLTAEELTKILQKCVEKIEPVYIREIVSILPEKESIELIQKYVGKNQLDDAIMIANLLPEPQRVEFLRIL